MKPSTLIRLTVLSLIAWTLIFRSVPAVASSIWPDTLTAKQSRDAGDYYITKIDPRKIGQVGDTVKITLDTTWAKKRIVEFTKPVKFRLTPTQMDSLGYLIRLGLVGLPEGPKRDSALNDLVKVK